MVLLDTCPAGCLGSMSRYAKLVEEVLQDLPACHESFELQTLHISIPGKAFRRLSPRLRTWCNHLWLMATAPSRVNRTRPGLVHLLDGSYGYLLNRLQGFPRIATVHDLIPLLQQQGRLGPSQPSSLARWLVKRSISGLRGCTGLIAVSSSTLGDLQKAANIRNTAFFSVPNALDSLYLEELEKDDAASAIRQGRRQSLILHVGNNGHYKNRAGVLRIFSRIRKYTDSLLIMVGPEPPDSLLRLVGELGLEDCVEFLDDVEDRALRDLYREASLLLFPSLYEGFGWPPLEAMACSCPVVCSNEGSLAEVVGDAALMAPANDEAQLARHCLAVLQDHDFADNLRARGKRHARRFTRERMAAQLLATYQQVLGQQAFSPAQKAISD